jgi:nascent polypeptide-associated complex subunit alpha
MQQAMKKMGIKQTNIDGVTEVIIRTADREIVITGAEVVCVDMHGSHSYQISGKEEIREPRSISGSPAAASFPEEDIELVMSQTGCDRERAVKALEDAVGQPAEAILAIMTG